MKFLAIVMAVLTLNLSSAFAATEMGFLCHADTDSFNGYFGLTTKIQGYMTIEEDKAIIHGYQFSYEIMDGNYVWSKADVEQTGDVANNANYRPRVYKQHFQFDLSQGIFGLVKFLVPFNAAQSEDDRFTAVLIMTYIDDHAGDSVMLECSID